eukprot:scaffold33926_cov48-Phaeocystis_antarctica.AAC.1
MVTITQGQLDPNNPYECYDNGQLVRAPPASSKIVVTGSGTNGNGEQTYNFRSSVRDTRGGNPSSFFDPTTSSPTTSPGGGQQLMQQQAVRLNFKDTPSFVVKLGAVWPGHDTYADFANVAVNPNTHMNQKGDTVTLGANLFPPGVGHNIQFGVMGNIIASSAQAAATHAAATLAAAPSHRAPTGKVGSRLLDALEDGSGVGSGELGSGSGDLGSGSGDDGSGSGELASGPPSPSPPSPSPPPPSPSPPPPSPSPPPPSPLPPPPSPSPPPSPPPPSPSNALWICLACWAGICAAVNSGMKKKAKWTRHVQDSIPGALRGVDFWPLQTAAAAAIGTKHTTQEFAEVEHAPPDLWL